ncbi:MAG: hypothetical protein QM705_05975 [Ancrocorticia sp.]
MRRNLLKGAAPSSFLIADDGALSRILFTHLEREPGPQHLDVLLTRPIVESSGK